MTGMRVSASGPWILATDMDHAWLPILHVNNPVSIFCQVCFIEFEPDQCVPSCLWPADMPPQCGIWSKCNTTPTKRGKGQAFIGPRRPWEPRDGGTRVDPDDRGPGAMPEAPVSAAPPVVAGPLHHTDGVQEVELVDPVDEGHGPSTD